MTIYNLTKESEVLWKGSKLGGSSHTGSFENIKGEITVENDEITKAQFTIDMNSLTNSDIESDEYKKKFLTHMKSDDFFDVEKFPTAVFELKEKVGVGNQKVSGQLTLKGKTADVSFDAEILKEENLLSAKAKFVIDRTVWDVRYGSGKFFKGLGDKAIKDEIEIQLELVALKE